MCTNPKRDVFFKPDGIRGPLPFALYHQALCSIHKSISKLMAEKLQFLKIDSAHFCRVN